MKKLLFLAIMVLYVVPVMAANIDSTYALTKYISEGRTPDYIIGQALQYNCSDVANQLKHFVQAIPLPDKFGATMESTYVSLFVVPKGYTLHVHSLKLAAFQEVDGATTQAVTMGVCWYDSSGATLDTVVATLSIDADSIDYSKIVKSLTLLDTTFASGDQAWAKLKKTINAAATTTLKGGVLLLDATLDK
jgi:hypothetical protein